MSLAWPSFCSKPRLDPAMFVKDTAVLRSHARNRCGQYEAGSESSPVAKDGTGS